MVESDSDGTGHRYGIVVARFNPVVTEALLEGAIRGFLDHGVAEEAIEVHRVPGAWELPPASARLVERGGIDGIVALGCVIRGETPHFDFVAGEASRGLGSLAITASIPVIFGVLTTETLEQALVRAGSQSDDWSDNKGWEAAVAAIEMANLYRTLR
ncbi:MAG: 6,7-dimethyl-8-ribityllumazine synthase [Gemmatimonadales bacterium]|nr:MAG: 6,7-dimethyl-8-ribityllumazine synthase [Gemmatimonadales bacterium]